MCTKFHALQMVDNDFLFSRGAQVRERERKTKHIIKLVITIEQGRDLHFNIYAVFCTQKQLQPPPASLGVRSSDE